MASLQILVLCSILVGQVVICAPGVPYEKREKQGTALSFGEVNFSSINCVGGACYIFVKAANTWQMASAVCQRYGGFLAEVTNAQQSDAVEQFRKTLPQYRGVWLGGHDLGAEGHWNWQHSMRTIPKRGDSGFQLWKAGEPNDAISGEHCLLHEARNGGGQWNDYFCNYKMPFVCQKS